MRQLLFLLLLIPFLGTSQELKTLRLEYQTATLDMHTAEALLKSLTTISKKDEPTYVAYKGALLTVQAKFTGPLKDKKSYFKEGVRLLEHAISEQPENIELRCLRMGVQENSPKILKYKDKLEEDKKFLIDHYSTSVKNKEIKDLIEGYVRQSAQFTNAEKELF